MSALLRQKVDLRFPIEIPGGAIASVTARPVTAEEFQVMGTSIEASLRVFANCVRLPLNVVEGMDDVDHEAVVSVIATLSRKAQEQFLAVRPAPFMIIEGGKQ